MTSATYLRLGTRSSLLALAQSRQVAAQLEAAHPHLHVKLVHIETRGDRDLHTPLPQTNDPDFFSAELDQALIAGEVDLCVHSYKDLSPQRPDEIAIVAIPERADPRDVILFRGDIQERLKQNTPLRIGSCSVRRQYNLEDFLPGVLPLENGLKFVPLRGPVDQRVRHIMADEHVAQLDGVVLALAGLSRLWSDPAGRAALAPALQQARWMVLPLAAVPTAHGQGALAIECRRNDRATKLLLQAIHCETTANLLDIEKSLLAEQADDDTAFGVTALAAPELGFAAWLRGRDRTGNTVCVARSNRPDTKVSGAAWDDHQWRANIRAEIMPAELPTDGAVFVAHWRALSGDNVPAGPRYWTSGIASWQRLARQGVWIEGCADNLGFDFVRPLLGEPVLGLPQLNNWTALTHADALTSWADSGIDQIIATYRSVADFGDTRNLANELAGHRHFYWSSSAQYKALREWLPHDAHHACGAGKTLRSLREAGLSNVQAFISREEWQQWLS